MPPASKFLKDTQRGVNSRGVVDILDGTFIPSNHIALYNPKPYEIPTCN